jgi:hypothetical protein
MQGMMVAVKLTKPMTRWQEDAYGPAAIVQASLHLLVKQMQKSGKHGFPPPLFLAPAFSPTLLDSSNSAYQMRFLEETIWIIY